MKPEELKKKTILVKYVIPDNLPERGYRRLQYYTSFADDPEKYHLGLIVRTKYSREKLDEWVRKGQLVDLRESIILPYEKELYLDAEGNVIMASGYNPKDEERKLVVSPSEFRKAKMLLKQLDDTSLKVNTKTKILAI